MGHGLLPPFADVEADDRIFFTLVLIDSDIEAGAAVVGDAPLEW